MGNKSISFAMLVVGLSLGTAWAIRGQFGHEYGAAWAGAIGSLSVLLVAKRTDWYARFFAVTLAGAIGWGIGGLASYGIVVGYGRDTEFINVFYGLSMLFVIGGLYGFIGGGLFGLALTDSPTKPVKWHEVIVEMVVGGALFYFFLIEEFDWRMTPPRSEMWAVCFGAAVALTWYLVRHRYDSALRVAVFAGLGGGFGFAFGNFLQVLGNLTDIKFNFWNVMEYSLGFFGGLGMAYGTLTSEWESNEPTQPKRQIWFPLLMVMLVIPYIVWQQSFELERLQDIFSKIDVSPDSPVIGTVQLVSLGMVLGMTGWCWLRFYQNKANPASYSENEVFVLFLSLWGLYILFSLFITGAFMSGYRIEQYLYIVNWLLVAFLIGKAYPVFTPSRLAPKQWAINFGIVLVFFALLTSVLIHSHGELKGSHKRFGAPPPAEESQ
ncbi:photosystem II biosynthesis protein [Spirosoma aerolatum]|uniref:photosystem II biosynthesis protein n=1 Tax=Spirosoma aerolatum TaxID=1211326 RepID=UPI001FE6809A|nr:photosystem II biosynthesis protein [Spirosoma aerolatum]